MPLQAVGPAGTLIANRLNVAFGCGRNRHNPGAEFGERLVVVARGLHLGIREAEIAALILKSNGREMVQVRLIKVLVQSAPAGNIRHLRAATDGEHRNLVLKDVADEREIGLVLQGVDVVELIAFAGLTIVRRIDVSTAGHEHPVHAGKTFGPVAVRHRQQGMRVTAGGPDQLQQAPRRDERLVAGG